MTVERRHTVFAAMLALLPWLSAPFFLVLEIDGIYEHGLSLDVMLSCPAFFGFNAIATGVFAAVALLFTGLKDRYWLSALAFGGSAAAFACLTLRSMM